MKIQEYIKLLFEVQINAQVAHWQTESYAQHKALEKLYLDVVELRDSLVESLQSEGIIKGYKSPIINESMDIVSFLEDVIESSRLIREELPSDSQNIIDELITLFKTTIYKLKFLK